jgi:hypothetical protein
MMKTVKRIVTIVNGQSLKKKERKIAVKQTNMLDKLTILEK